MKIISWNVNGLRAIVKKGFAEFLSNERPDIICLQEIKIDDVSRAKHEFDFFGMYEYFCPAFRPGYSGTAILSKTALKVVNGMGIEEFDSEGRVITAETDDFYLINCYFPNSQELLKRLDYKVHFNQVLLEYAKSLEIKKPVIITGDFNVAHLPIDLARPKENEGTPGYSVEERRGMDEFIKAGLVDTFRYLHPDDKKYTWWSYRAGARQRNVGWRIDYFLMSKSLLKCLKSAEIMNEVQGSDHCPILCEIFGV